MNFYHGRKHIGTLDGDTFTKTVKRKRHLLKYLNAYAIDKSVVAVLQEKKANFIKVHEKDTGDTYQISLQSFVEMGISVNYGYGDQIATPLKYWTKPDNPQPPLFP